MCDTCEWEQELEKVNEMLECGDYEWADDTLSGIAEWVYEKKHITAKQVDAIANIRRARE